MPVYDNSLFDPPAPVAQVIIHRTEEGISCEDVPMLIDSGADVTLLPAKCVQRLGIDLESAVKYELMAFDGSTSFAYAVSVNLHFLHRTFRGRFLVTNQECGILGRDILNHLSLLLDGPQEHWKEMNGKHGTTGNG